MGNGVTFLSAADARGQDYPTSVVVMLLATASAVGETQASKNYGELLWEPVATVVKHGGGRVFLAGAATTGAGTD